MKLNPGKTALTVGVFAGLWHVVWGLLIAGGLASQLLDFIYGIHFLNNPFVVQSFDLVKWITLIVVTAILGYIFGYVFSLLWNRIQK
jgi:hypothetical protein